MLHCVSPLDRCVLCCRARSADWTSLLPGRFSAFLLVVDIGGAAHDFVAWVRFICARLLHVGLFGACWLVVGALCWVKCEARIPMNACSWNA